MQYFQNRIVRILKIPTDSCLSRACLNTGRLQIVVNAMIAESAFIRGTQIMRDITASIGACLDTISATDTMIPIHQNNAVGRMIGCTHGTDLRTRRISAVIAQFWNKKPLYYLFILYSVLLETMPSTLGRIDMDLFILIYFIAFNPSAEKAVGDFVFYPAGSDTGAATYTAGCINDKGPVEAQQIF